MISKNSPCCDQPLMKFVSGGGKNVSGAYMMCHACRKEYKVNYKTDELIIEESKMDIKYKLRDKSKTKTDYRSLERVLVAAYRQASGGKGSDRHGNDLPFDEQPMQVISDLLGTSNGCLFQAMKKIQESTRMDYQPARNELLGAINYIAGAIIHMERMTNGFD